jgi:hypothetical protein
MRFGTVGAQWCCSYALLLQHRHGHKWGTQLNSVDLGPIMHAPMTIEAGKSAEFKFQTSGSGKQRFVLYYSNGDNDTVCKNPHDTKKAISPTFTVLAHEQH